MSNLTEIQRLQLDRPDLTESRGARLTSATAAEQRLFTILSAVFLVVFAALTYTAITVFHGWDHLIVIGDIVILFWGVALWVYPKRKRIY
jgi:uncharacterized protein (DUF983 family)